MNVAAYIDHTILKPTTTSSNVIELCSEAAANHFAAVCVPPTFVHLARQQLVHSGVKVATVVGFPFGYSVANAKLAEVQQALTYGADELDVVINLSALKSGRFDLLEREMKLIVTAIHEAGKIVKVIVESGILSNEELLECCRLYSRIGVDFMKTSTGYAEKGASLHAVQLMRANLPSGIKIKASGGIRSYESAMEYIRAGADRIGTSSGVAILNQQLESI